VARSTESARRGSARGRRGRAAAGRRPCAPVPRHRLRTPAAHRRKRPSPAPPWPDHGAAVRWTTGSATMIGRSCPPRAPCLLAGSRSGGEVTLGVTRARPSRPRRAARPH